MCFQRQFIQLFVKTQDTNFHLGINKQWRTPGYIQSQRSWSFQVFHGACGFLINQILPRNEISIFIPLRKPGYIQIYSWNLNLFMVIAGGLHLNPLFLYSNHTKGIATENCLNFHFWSAFGCFPQCGGLGTHGKWQCVWVSAAWAYLN